MPWKLTLFICDPNIRAIRQYLWDANCMAIRKNEFSPDSSNKERKPINLRAPNGLRYLRVGGRGFGWGAGKKTEAGKMPENAAESHQSAARCVRRLFLRQLVSLHLF
jgi:hypothetical protein